MLYSFSDQLASFMMKKTLKEHFKNFPEELSFLLNYHTRLSKAATIQSFVVWKGNRGYVDAAFRKPSLRLAASLRLTAFESDVLDTMDDEFRPEVLSLKHKLYAEEFEARRRTYNFLAKVSQRLKSLVYERFRQYHSSSLNLYQEGRTRLEAGQEEDKAVRLHLLQDDVDWLREKFPSWESAVKLLEKKLGLMGAYIARIVYMESGGESEEIQDYLSEFWLCSAVLMQMAANDFRKLEEDVANKETNPVVIAVLCEEKKIRQISLRDVGSYLKENLFLLEKLPEPHLKGMMESLKKLETAGFNPRDHRAIAALVRETVNREKSSLINRLGA